MSNKEKIFHALSATLNGRENVTVSGFDIDLLEDCMTTKIRAYHADGYCVESTREMEIDDNGEEVALYRYHSADYDGFTRVCESVFIEMVAGLSQNKARS